MNNCEKCHARYESYQIGEKEDCSTSWCQIPISEKIGTEYIEKTPKGLCQFCNPKSKLYIQ